MMGIRGLLIPSLAYVSAPDSSCGHDFFRFLHGCSFLSGFISSNVHQNWWDCSFQDDSTATHLLSEVKHLRGQLVLRWGTTLESLMLIFLPLCLFFFFFACCSLAVHVLLVPHLSCRTLEAYTWHVVWWVGLLEKSCRRHDYTGTDQEPGLGTTCSPQDR